MSDLYIKRDLEKDIAKYLDKREILAVIGPRQSGKTTLLRRFFESKEKAVFLDFEDRKILDLFLYDIDSFIALYVLPYEYVFIDEFQYAKNGGKQLKYIFDHFHRKLIISGSSATELSVQSIKHLVGRIFVFSLFPLSFKEFLRFKDEKLLKLLQKSRGLSKEVIDRAFLLYEEFCIYGGYPRVVLSSDNEEILPFAS